MMKRILAGTLFFVFVLAGTVNAAPTSRYTVKQGDTFGKIAWENGLTVSQLADANPQVSNIDWISAGQILNLPASDWEEKADRIIARGLSYLGTPYLYGAQRFQDRNFDCSSFVQFVFHKEGIALGWTAREQAVQGEWVPFDQMRKGDLMFFLEDSFPNEQGLSRVRHVGIYMGDGRILHTYEPGTGVTVSKIRGDSRKGDHWYTHFLFAKRVIQ